MSLDHAMKQRLDRIRAALAALRAFDPAHEVFGADTHHHDLAPPLPEETIAAFERDHCGATLPPGRGRTASRCGAVYSAPGADAGP
jgi:hypothetical protein